MASYIEGYDTSDTSELRRKRKQPVQGSYGFAAMERRMKRKRPPVGEDSGSEDDLGRFSRSYSSNMSSFSRR